MPPERRKTPRPSAGAVLALVAVLLILTGMTGPGADRSVALPDDLVNTEPSAACRVGVRLYESDRGSLLLGDVIRTDFPRLLPDWAADAPAYETDPGDIAVLADFDRPVEIICVVGTWCHDSEREVPRLWQILDEVDNPHLELTMFAVGRSSDPRAKEILAEIGFDDDLRLTYDVQAVPTFIFSVDGVEWGRIIETPQQTLERDAALILSRPEQAPAAPARPVFR